MTLHSAKVMEISTWLTQNTAISVYCCICVHYIRVSVKWKFYSAIKFPKHSSTLLWVDNNDTDGFKSGRQVVVRCSNATPRRNNSVKMAALLQHTPKKNSTPAIVFYVVKVWNALKLIDEWKFRNVMHVCHYSKCTRRLGSSWTALVP